VARESIRAAALSAAAPIAARTGNGRTSTRSAPAGMPLAVNIFMKFDQAPVA